MRIRPLSLPRIVPLLAVFALGLASGSRAETTSQTEAATEVRAAYEAYLEARSAGDWRRVWDAITESSRASQDHDFDLFLEAVARPRTEEQETLRRRTTRKVLEVTVDGDSASILVEVEGPLSASAAERIAAELGLPAEKAPLVKRRITRKLMREDGAWKVDHPMATPAERRARAREREERLPKTATSDLETGASVVPSPDGNGTAR